MRRHSNLGSLSAVALVTALAACGGSGGGVGGNDNGNGNVNLSAPCEPGTTTACYTGPAGTEGVGPCTGGTAECDADGAWGPCEGEVTPAAEDCAAAGDEDCDGQENQDDPDCGCVPGETAPCYTGPADTEGVGNCIGGEMECQADGSFGPCVGEITPEPENCNDAGDEDCDGLANEEGDGCSCVPGSTLPCYSGPAGTEGVGVCVGGTMTCDNTGTGYGPCEGEITPTAETCSTLEDDDCDGLVNEEGADCVCVPGSTTPCYPGPAGTENNAPCQPGLATCNADGLGYGLCVGEVLPTPEICANNIDEDCNGTADDVPDIDGDGWTACDGDCCEVAGPTCADPHLVNPGAFEFVGNGVDDDCDPSTPDTVAAPDCSTAQDFTVTPNQMAQAMDLCQFTTANEPLPTRKWGVVNASFRTPAGANPSATQLSSMQNSQAAVLVNYGNVIVPQMGPTMAGISTGYMRDAGDPGYPGSPSSSMGFNQQPPAVYLTAHGGNLPASASCMGSCPSGSGANDGVNLRLEIRVPTNALSFAYQFRFFSYEYWNWACSSFNDFYLALLQSGASGIPADRNISFDSLNNPVSVNNGFFEVCAPHNCYTCPSGIGELAGTGMEVGNNGGGTVWLQTTAPVVPGETMILELMIFDVSDGILDSAALLDAFEWSIDPSGVGTTEG